MKIVWGVRLQKALKPEEGKEDLERCARLKANTRTLFNATKRTKDGGLTEPHSQGDGNFSALLKQGVDLLASRSCNLLRASLVLAYVTQAWGEIKLVFIPKYDIISPTTLTDVDW